MRTELSVKMVWVSFMVSFEVPKSVAPPYYQ